MRLRNIIISKRSQISEIACFVTSFIWIPEQAELICSEKKKKDLWYLEQKVEEMDWEGAWMKGMFYILIGVVVTWCIHMSKLNALVHSFYCI